jgi:hypothetical protein
VLYALIPSNPQLTTWTKAVDFNGTSQRLKQSGGNYGSINALRMQNFAQLVAPNLVSSRTSDASAARPWATAIVFQTDGDTVNQHIWNIGEGHATADDNIYIRTDSARKLYFAWGRSGAYNECTISSTSLSVTEWYGVYVCHKGARWSAGNATAANLATTFDIRIMSSVDQFQSLGANLSTAAAWTTTGAAMNESVTEEFTVGGRGANRSFDGRVSSMVVTTLLQDTEAPSEAEATEMITDPVGWLQDYKVGNPYRAADSPSPATSNFTLDDPPSSKSALVWIMGDGSNDTYAAGIRNQSYILDQNFTRLNFQSMASTDIETVSITGLT